MASGRRDYTWGFLNETAVEGRYTESFIQQAQAGLAAGQTTILYSYLVPAGYRLTVNRIIFSTSSRGVNRAAVIIYPDTIGYHYFSDNYSIIFSDQNPCCLSAGKTLQVVCINDDEATYPFNCSVIGSLMHLI